MRRLLILVSCFWLVAADVQAAKRVSWEDLKDPASQNFEDPFEALNILELRSLATVVRLRKQLDTGNVSEDNLFAVMQQLEAAEAKLAVSGVDTDALLSRRQEIADKRLTAAITGNAALDNQTISITGYVIPVLEPDGTSRGGYLVPQYGMCSHVPAPDPNQMIRYQAGSSWQPDRIYQRVRLTGRIDLTLTRQTINLLDGEVDMVAALNMTDAVLHPDKAFRPRPQDRTLFSAH
ncbi:DUF3299 domain-containing protein [Roseibium denhamense]|uniref:DUF3299 domain-containing protein n=1 Tax=Roseibium denhamense TaxID=76305 RepID=A0ABY1PA72_9HYPH|nr:DUF3299 domain-containing protein [Roseibium denhamense]MTI07479.1 DUF3299 domain-containing protein [Roseibium denhamense]SMP29985.1 hypothetical protein SAMN06265374_3174 [Roseibium denhamense]